MHYKRKLNKILAVTLALIMLLPGGIARPAVGQAETAPTSIEKHYFLDVGVVFIWRNSAKVWQYGRGQGSTYSSKADVGIADLIGVDKDKITNVNVHPYKKGEFSFNTPNFNMYEKEYAPTQFDFDNEYHEYSTTGTQISNIKYNPNTGRMTYNYSDILKTPEGVEFDVKKLLEMKGTAGEDEIYARLGYTRETAPMDIRKPIEDLRPSKFSQNVLGFMYFPIKIYECDVAVEKSTYSIVSSGFVNDGTTATVDYKDSSGILLRDMMVIEDILLNIENYGEFQKTIQTALMAHSSIARASDVAKIYERLYAQGRTDEVVQLRERLIADPVARNNLRYYGIIQMAETLGKETGLSKETEAGIISDLRLSLLQSILETGLYDDIFNPKLIGKETYYKGTDVPVKNEYFALTPLGLEKLKEHIKNILENQIGIDRKFQGKMDDSELAPILYISTNVSPVNIKNMPKNLIKAMADEFTKDLIAEIKNVDGETTDNGAALNIISKWANEKWETDSLLSYIEVAKLFDILYNTGQSYGAYDEEKGMFKCTYVNEEMASRLFGTLVLATDAWGTSKVFRDQSGREIDKSTLGTHFANSSGYAYHVSAPGEGSMSITKILADGLDQSKRYVGGTLNKGGVEALTRLASIESAVRSTAEMVEKADRERADIDGKVGISIIGYDKSIPIDAYVVIRDGQGETVPIMLTEEYTRAVPNYEKVLQIPTEVAYKNEKTNRDVTVPVTNVIIKPAYEGLKEFLDAADNANRGGGAYVDLDGARSYFLKSAGGFRFNNTTTFESTGKTQNDLYENSIMFSLTHKDQMYYNSNRAENRPALIIYVEPEDSILQVDIIENEEGQTEQVMFSNPTVVGDEVKITPTYRSELIEWVVSDEETDPFDLGITWNDVKKVPKISSGGPGQAPKVKVDSKQIVYVRYKREPALLDIQGDLEISEKRITKAFDLTDIGSLHTFGFSYGSTGKHGHRFCDEDGCWTVYYSRSSPVETYYRYVVQRYNQLNALAVGTVGDFMERYNETNITEGNASHGGGGSTVTPNMFYVTWRGRDKPTIASYKEDGEHPLTQLGLKVDKRNRDERNKVGGYEDSIMFNLAQSYNDNADYQSTFVCSYCGGSSVTQTHSSSDKSSYDATLGVHTFIGKENIGNDVPTEETTAFSIGAVTFNKAKGYTIVNPDSIKFFPYVQMAYDTPATDPDGTNVSTKAVNVLAAHESTIRPVDHVDVGWVNNRPTTSFDIASQQWSTHKKAVDARGRNNVLPGGAIYRLTTDSITKVGLSIWQHYIPAEQLDAVTAGADKYTLGQAGGKSDKLIEDSKKSLDSLDVVQFVDNNPGKATAFGGTKLNARGGQKVYGNTTSNDPKYHMIRGTPQASNKANEADLDIIKEVKVKTYYRVDADVDGNVFVRKSTNGSSWSVLQKFTKTEGIGALTNAEALLLNSKTRLVTNFLDALDRNRGNDETVGNGPEWYNEAWDGIGVMRTDVILDIGFKTPGIRTAALDPKLTPPRTGQSDLFGKYYISQFRLNEKSAIREPKAEGYLGTISDVDIMIPEMHNMYMSRRFYIPNITVMDLIN